MTTPTTKLDYNLSQDYQPPALIWPRRFAERLDAIRAAFPDGTSSARDAAFALMVECLYVEGHGFGLFILEKIMGGASFPDFNTGDPWSPESARRLGAAMRPADPDVSDKTKQGMGAVAKAALASESALNTKPEPAQPAEGTSS